MYDPIRAPTRRLPRESQPPSCRSKRKEGGASFAEGRCPQPPPLSVGTRGRPNVPRRGARVRGSTAPNPPKNPGRAGEATARSGPCVMPVSPPRTKARVMLGQVLRFAMARLGGANATRVKCPCETGRALAGPHVGGLPSTGSRYTKGGLSPGVSGEPGARTPPPRFDSLIVMSDVRHF